MNRQNEYSNIFARSRNLRNSRNHHNEYFREIVNSYNENVRIHNQHMIEYHHNMRYILAMLDSYNFSPESIFSMPRSARTRQSPISSSQINSDLSSLIYLLNSHFNGRTTSPVSPHENNDNTLSVDQIENATQNVLYSPLLGETRCPISLEEFNENDYVCQIKHCGHIFKRTSLMRWFERYSSCPVCRYNLHDYPEENIRNNTATDMDIDIDIDENTTSSGIDTASTRSTINNISRLLTDLISENIPGGSLDSSNNLIYTFDIPLYFNRV
jgi:hypothetical protein